MNIVKPGYVNRRLLRYLYCDGHITTTHSKLYHLRYTFKECDDTKLSRKRKKKLLGTEHKPTWDIRNLLVKECLVDISVGTTE